MEQYKQCVELNPSFDFPWVCVVLSLSKFIMGPSETVQILGCLSYGEWPSSNRVHGEVWSLWY